MLKSRNCAFLIITEIVTQRWLRWCYPCEKTPHHTTGRAAHFFPLYNSLETLGLFPPASAVHAPTIHHYERLELPEGKWGMFLCSVWWQAPHLFFHRAGQLISTVNYTHTVCVCMCGFFYVRGGGVCTSDPLSSCEHLMCSCWCCYCIFCCGGEKNYGVVRVRVKVRARVMSPFENDEKQTPLLPSVAVSSIPPKNSPVLKESSAGLSF